MQAVDFQVQHHVLPKWGFSLDLVFVSKNYKPMADEWLMIIADEDKE